MTATNREIYAAFRTLNLRQQQELLDYMDELLTAQEICSNPIHAIERYLAEATLVTA